MATMMSSSLAQACNDPRDGAVRESGVMLGLGPMASPLPACRCGHSAEGGLSTQGELAPHGATSSGGATGLPGEGQGSISHQSDFPTAPPCAVHALGCARALQLPGCGSQEAAYPGSPMHSELLSMLCPQDASPITSLQLSSKRVRGDPWPFPCPPFLCHSVGVLSSALPPASALRWLSHSAGPAAPTPLWCLWQSLCRMLPGPGPILCLGWQHLHPLRAQHQEVGDMPGCSAGAATLP